MLAPEASTAATRGWRSSPPSPQARRPASPWCAQGGRSRGHGVLKVDDSMSTDIHLLTGDVEQHMGVVLSILDLTKTTVCNMQLTVLLFALDAFSIRIKPEGCLGISRICTYVFLEGKVGYGVLLSVFFFCSLISAACILLYANICSFCCLSYVAGIKS
jgi:hypothetical protein